MNRVKSCLGVLFLVILVLGMLAAPVVVFAIEDPDYVTIEDTYVFRNVSEEGDQLYFCRYDVSYNSTPDEDADETWQMAVYNSSGSLVATRALNYYQHNIISIYLTPDQAIGWGMAHRIRVMGMPSVFGSLTEGVNMRTSTLAFGDYYEAEDLGEIMLDQAQILEDDWEITLISGSVLNETGGTFFLIAVPGLGDMVPEIFEVITGGMDVDYVEYNQTYRETLQSNQGSRLSGAVSDLSSMMGVQNSEWTAFWLVSLVFLMVVGTMSTGVGMPGWTFAGGYAVLAGAAYVFGGSLFTFVIVLGVVVAAIFGIYFILERFA